MEKLNTLRVMGFWWTFFGGHFSIGNFTFFGENAMDWSVTISGTRWGHIHIDLPTFSRIFGKKKWCCYVSPNGTPWACTWYIGSKNPKEKIWAQIRKFHFGHNNKEIASRYSAEKSELYELNQRMDVIMWPIEFSE